MYVVPESVASELVDLDAAIAAVRAAYVQLQSGTAELFPVATGTGSDRRNGFAVKSGRVGSALGVKVGSYWPGNAGRGSEAHASTVLLLDDDTGYPRALIGASHLTALRTAAVDAVAVDALARGDATRLVVVGTGHQSHWDALAIARVRGLDHVSVWGRDADAAERRAGQLRDAGLPAEAVPDLTRALAGADIVTTVTSSDRPLFDRSQLAPGVHVSAMGADAPGKQELDPAVLDEALLVADLPEQALRIGEFRHAAREGRIGPEDLVPLGAVLCGDHPGREDQLRRTVFDSSGTALQDLAVCTLALDAAVADGSAIEV